MSNQIAIRLPNDLAAALDELVASGRFTTRAQAVRAALETLVDRERRGLVGAAIAESYRRAPQTDEEVGTATEAAIRSIHEEPW